MIVQLSSGQGPVECELAVVKLFEALKKEYKDIELIEKHEGKAAGCCTSIMFKTESDMSELEGTVEWICRSPFRPEHKRKNWFVDVSIIPQAEHMRRDGEIIFERFHSGGNGGQNVNKVETGVRLVHVPTGIAVTSTAERSQLQNRRAALEKLNAMLAEKEEAAGAEQKNKAWREHTKIERGNPVRVYKGADFKRA